MASIFDFSRSISDLKKNKKYSEALIYFKANKADFTKEKISQNEYLVSDMIACLRFTRNYEAVFKFLNIYGIRIDKQSKERVLTAYGWVLWSKYKSDAEDSVRNNENILKIQVLIPLLQNLDSSFSETLISNLLSVVLKTEKNKPSPNWKMINDFCNSFAPDKLSTNCSTIQVERKGKLQNMKLASDLENWYASQTKALLKLGGWQECFEVSKKAIETLDVFHYSNDIWFSRRIALSKKNLGNTKDTIVELKKILNKKKEWFIQKELAELYFEEENFEKAFIYAIDAINNFGPLEFKVDLLYLMGEIHQKQKKFDLAFKHHSLSKLIRELEEWKIPQKTIEALQSLDNTEITTKDFDKLKSDLKKYWKLFTPKKKKIEKSKQLQGTILKFLNDNERGKDGFLIHENSQYYFNLSSNYHLTKKINIDTKVSFELKPSKTGNKKQAKINGIVNSRDTVT